MSGELGNYNQRRLDGAISGPITDTIGFRLSAGANKRDGYIENGAGEDLNNADSWHALGKLLFLPSDSLSIQLNASYAARDNTCCGADAVQTPALLAELNVQGFPAISQRCL